MAAEKEAKAKTAHAPSGKDDAAATTAAVASAIASGIAFEVMPTFASTDSASDAAVAAATAATAAAATADAADAANSATATAAGSVALGGGVVVCSPRLDRKTAVRAGVPRSGGVGGGGGSGYLGQWLQHHHARDAAHFFIYSDDCLDKRSLESLAAAREKPSSPSSSSSFSSLHSVANRGGVTVVDISGIREFPGWYHHQMLTMKVGERSSGGQII
jgi:hypothetical protein